MGLKIADLLKWRTSLVLKDEEGNPIRDNGEDVTVWLRVIGDEDIQEAYRKARAASARKRKVLTSKDTDEFVAAVEPIATATKEELIDVIKTARQTNLPAEASVAVEREEELKMEEFAVDPDAPTLEEQEKFDAAVAKQEEDYYKALGEYQLSRISGLEKELEAKDIEALRKEAEDDVIAIIAHAAFIQELVDQKTWRAVYTDKACKERAFESVEEYRETDAGIKEQLLAAYLKLEQGPDEVKN